MILTMLIIGHMEIGGGFCRTDLMLPNNVLTTMEYPCEYYSELKDVDDVINNRV